MNTLKIKNSKPTYKNYFVLLAMSLSVLVLAFNTSAQVNALLKIKTEFNISAASIQWVINIYMLMAASFILIAGRFGDYFDRKKIFILSCFIYLFSSIFIAMSSSSFQLISGRALQGFAAAFMCSSSMAIIKTEFNDEHLIWAVGIWSAMAGIGCAVGPFGGGIITDLLSWRYIFWFNAFITFTAIVVTAIWLQPDKTNSGKIKIDFKGLLIFFASAFLIVFALSYSNEIGWKNWIIPSILLIGIILLGLFYKFEKCIDNPLVHFHFFSNRIFLFANIGIATTIFIEMALPYFLNYYLQNSTTFNYSASKSGMFLLPFTALLFVFSLLSSVIVRKTGAKKVIFISFLLTTVSLIIISVSGYEKSLITLLTGLLLSGVAIGAVNPLLSSLALSALPEENIGEASGILNTLAYFSELSAVTFGNIIFFSVGRVFLSPVVAKSDNIKFDAYDQLLLGYKDQIESFLELIKHADRDLFFSIIQNAAKICFSSIMIFTAVLTFTATVISIFLVMLNKKDKLL